MAERAGPKLVALKDVRRLTGLDPIELLRGAPTQKLARIDQSGTREELVRIPVDLLIQTRDEEPFA